MKTGIRELIAEKLAMAERKDHHGVLGVEPGTDDLQLKRAYFSLVKRLHPDRIDKASLTPELIEAAEEAYRAVGKSYAHLCDPIRRARGGRIGQGKGFYDRFLKTLVSRAHFVALAYQCQIFSSIPIDQHDIQMDVVVTEDDIYRAC